MADSVEWATRLEWQNRWVDETICAVASLYVLPKVEAEWTAHPPFRDAARYAPSFGHYAASEGADTIAIPPASGFARWLSANLGTLKTHPYVRSANTTVAVRLLPLFQGDPEMWTCVTYLESGAGASDRGDLRALLRSWKLRAPALCSASIDAFSAILGVDLR